jgi:hypothetical protein
MPHSTLLREERGMSIGYTWEKLYGAVLALACSDGTRQDRLVSAYRAMHMLTLADFPDDELREAYARFVQALRPGEPEGVAGTVAPSSAVLRSDQARAIAEKLLLLYTDITRFEEQHYRSIPPRDV